MMEKEKHLNDLKEIKMMMEQSSKFISLSGLSGISAGVCGLIGAAAAYMALLPHQMSSRPRQADTDGYFPLTSSADLAFDLVLIAVVTLGAALILSTFFTVRRARINQHSMWNTASKRLFVSMSLPLIAGGLFCLILIYHGLIGLVAPCTLIFFGLALVHASKFTLPEIRYVGVVNILLGLVNGIFIGHGLFFWALGFGVVNIIYGVYMYLKYDRQE